MRIQSKGWDAKVQQLFITERADRYLLRNDILLNLGIEVLQKQPLPTVLDVRKTPSKPPLGIDVNQIKFETDRQPCQHVDTPIQREFKLYISGRFRDLFKRTGRSKIFIVNTPL